MLEDTIRRLNEFHNSDILSQWFLDNYIQPLTREFFSNATSLRPKFVNYMPHWNEYRKATTDQSVDFLFSIGISFCNLNTQKIKVGLRSGLRDFLQRACVVRKFSSLLYSTVAILETAENIWCFTYYDAALNSLSATYCLDCGKLSWDSGLFVEYVKANSLQPKIVRCQHHIFPKPSIAARSQVNLILAQDLMEHVTGSNSRSEFQIMSILAKEFLRKALECDNSQSSGIASAALVNLAALYFATSEYQMVKDLCSAVLMGQTTYVEKETLNAACLFFIDDVVRIVGFWLLIITCRDNVRYNKRKKIFLDLRLTPEVFAYYLTVLSDNKIPMQLEIDRKLLPASAPPLDQLLQF